jgi:predicted GNAT family acetyltransferase
VAGEYVVHDNPDELRYELVRDDALIGEIRYRLEPDAIILVHTEIAPSAEGEGLGTRLVAGALADIRERGLKVVPLCQFVAAYIRRHPEERDLVRTAAEGR